MNRGVILAVLSSFTFSIMNVLVKLISSSIPSNEIAFFRGLIGTILIVFIMKWNKIEFSKSQRPLLFLRGILGGLYMVTYFYAISTMKLGDASILAHLSGIFVMIFSAMFLKETLPRKTIILIPVIILGACFIINPLRYSTYSIYAIFGVLSAILSAAAAITIRQLAKTKLHHNFEIVFYFLVASTIVAIPLMWNNFVIPTLQESLILLVLGVVSLLAQLFLTGAFSHENAVIVEIVRYIGLFFNALWGFMIWKEVLTIYSVIGAVLIVSSSIILSREKARM